MAKNGHKLMIWRKITEEKQGNFDFSEKI